ncbi:hypothetical protein SGPA1_20543 [Streptomyces misionensis JCM 4497]
MAGPLASVSPKTSPGGHPRTVVEHAHRTPPHSRPVKKPGPSVRAPSRRRAVGPGAVYRLSHEAQRRHPVPGDEPHPARRIDRVRPRLGR